LGYRCRHTHAAIEGALMKWMLGALFQLIPVAILGFFIWAVITISKQLDRIEALLTENQESPARLRPAD
jgi:hypothetical protein